MERVSEECPMGQLDTGCRTYPCLLNGVFQGISPHYRSILRAERAGLTFRAAARQTGIPKLVNYLRA